MSQLGMGVTINMIFGNSTETRAALQQAINKVIDTIEVLDEKIHIKLKDGPMITIWDDGQSCCEHRYLTTDADLNSYAGKTIKSFDLSPLPETGDENSMDYHERMQLDIVTDEGKIDFVTHNENNGYYGGFYIKAASSDPFFGFDVQGGVQ